MHRLLPLLLLALLYPAAAQADSIVYAKGADTWVARPDGSDGRRVAPGTSPTQANDGTILVQRGSRFARLDRQGRTLATLDSVLTGKPGNVNAVGPFDPVISPDGTKLAYWIGMYTSWTDHANHIEWTRTGPVVVWQDARDGRVLGVTHYYEEPSWLPDSSGALLFEESNALTAQVVASGVGEDHNAARQWFHDSDTKPANEEFWKPVGAGELAPGWNRLAVLRGGTNIGNGGMAQGRGNTIVTYGVSLPGLPVMECELRDAVGGEFGRPSWSPDGTSLAWSEGDGVWAMALGRDCSGTPRLVIPGGTEPDWGPADVGARILVRGGKVRVQVSCTCRIKVVARAGGRVVARASRHVDGSATLPIRSRARRLSVKVTLDPGGTVKRTVQLR